MPADSEPRDVSAPPPPVTASILGKYYHPSANIKVKKTDGLVRLVHLPAFSLPHNFGAYVFARGTTRYYFGPNDATYNSTPHLSQEMRLECTGDGTSNRMLATRNHRGALENPNVVSLKFMLKNTSGSSKSYDCALYGATGHAIDAAISYLEYQAQSTFIRRGSPTALVERWGARSGTAQVGPFKSIHRDLDKNVIAPPGWPAIEVWTQTSLTSCWKGFSAPCSDASTNQTYTDVDARLLVQQLSSSGSVCHTVYDPPSGYERTRIHGLRHHDQLFNEKLKVGFSSSCGSSRRFVPKMEYIWRSGPALLFHGGSGSSGYSQAWMGPYY